MDEVGFRAVGDGLIVRRQGPLYARHPMIVIATSDEWMDRTAMEVAEVVSLGPEVREDIHVGQQVLIGRYGGDVEFEHLGTEFTRCVVADVVAVLPYGTEGVA